MSIIINYLYEFGEFRIDTKEKILMRGEKTLKLTPKAFELLAFFVENHGRLLKKDEIMENIWAGSFVEESNLTFNIGQLRKILGDKAQKPIFIETVRHHGYRFIGEVQQIEKETLDSANDLSINDQLAVIEKDFEESVEKTSNQEFTKPQIPAIIPDPNEETIDSSGKSRIIASLVFVFLLTAAISVGYYFFFQKNSSISNKKSLVILPLKPINSAARDELYEIGIADSLINRLSLTKSLIVRPLSAIRKYADIEQDPLAAGKEQKVDYVLASNYQLADGKIRVTTQLLNVANEQIEETYKSEKDVVNIFTVQDTISNEIGNFLLTRFSANDAGEGYKRGTTNGNAYRLYLQGRYLVDKRNFADAKKAIEILQQAVQSDPNYARAWAVKAYAHRSAANYGRNTNAREEYQKSMEAINQALALDANLSEAYSVLCDNKMYYEYDFAGAERECKRAIELDSNSGLAHNIYSRYLNGRGRTNEAINEIKTAIDLEPTSFHNQRNLGVSLFFARRYEESAEQLRRVIAVDKNFASAYMWLGFTLEMLGNDSVTFEWFMKSPSVQNAGEETIRAFQNAFQQTGWQGVLRERIKRFAQSDDTFFQGAIYYIQLSEKDKAFEYLEKSFEQRELWMSSLQVDPRLDSLRDDPRFVRLVQRVELR